MKAVKSGRFAEEIELVQAEMDVPE